MGGSACASRRDRGARSARRSSASLPRRGGACSAVVGVTGSTGKTSTKDILSALLAGRLRVHASRENFNTEIGLPLTILEAARGTRRSCSRWRCAARARSPSSPRSRSRTRRDRERGAGAPRAARHGRARGRGQGRADPGGRRGLRGPGERAPARRPPARRPRHMDLRARRPGAVALDGRRPRRDRGAAGSWSSSCPTGSPTTSSTRWRRWPRRARCSLPLGGRVDVRSPRCGARSELPGGVVVVNDCYNANPMSMRAAIDHLGRQPAERRIAVLGTMAELGPDAERYHREIGTPAAERGVDARGGRRGERSATPRASTARPPCGHSLRRPARCSRRSRARAIACSWKGSRSVGLERVLAIDARRDRHRGSASLLICMFLGPASSSLRLKEFGQHIREEGPEAHHGKAARRRWAASRSCSPSASRS